MYITLNIPWHMDPVSVGREVSRAADEYARATGRTVAVTNR